MSSFVFVTWDGGGSLPPAVAIAVELQERGHDVRFLGHPSQAATLSEAGLPFTPYTSARHFTSRDPKGTLALLAMVSDRAMGKDVVAYLATQRTDLVVVDCLLFGVMDELRKVGQPYVVLEHLFDHALRHLAGGPLGMVLRLRGIRTLPLLDAARCRIVTTIAELDREHGDVVHVGTVVHGTPSQPEQPTIVISLSTFMYPALHATWQRLLDAVDGIDARVIATVGPVVDPGKLRVPVGVEVHEWIEHSQIMPFASLVVTHGGHGTTIAALAHNVPVLVMPLDRDTDQPYVGRAIEAAGVGRMLSRRSKPAQIRSAIDDLLADGRYRGAATRLGNVIRTQDGRIIGADRLESLAGVHIQSDRYQRV